MSNAWVLGNLVDSDSCAGTDRTEPITTQAASNVVSSIEKRRCTSASNNNDWMVPQFTAILSLVHCRRSRPAERYNLTSSFKERVLKFV